jgi:hypothetical protein
MPWRSRMLITLAGPAANLAELVIGAVLTAALWSNAGISARNVLVLSLTGLVLSVIYNLPVSERERDLERARTSVPPPGLR